MRGCLPDSGGGVGKGMRTITSLHRCPIFVDDLVDIVLKLISLPELPQSRVFNTGGPQRLSRVDMAEKVAESRGYRTSGIISVPSSSVQRYGVQKVVNSGLKSHHPKSAARMLGPLCSLLPCRPSTQLMPLVNRPRPLSRSQANR